RRHSGCLQPARRRLDDGRPPAGGAGAGGARYGAGRARGDLRRLGAPLGPRHPVRLRRLYHPADRAWHPAEHEPGRLSLRQRHGGELHENLEAGGGRRQRLSRPRRGRGGDRRFHRGGLQSPAPALGVGLPLARRVRGGRDEPCASGGCCAAAPTGAQPVTWGFSMSQHRGALQLIPVAFVCSFFFRLTFRGAAALLSAAARERRAMRFVGSGVRWYCVCSCMSEGESMSPPPTTDIEIDRAAEMLPIAEIAQRLDIPPDALDLYGPTKAKLTSS